MRRSLSEVHVFQFLKLYKMLFGINKYRSFSFSLPGCAYDLPGLKIILTLLPNHNLDLTADRFYWTLKEIHLPVRYLFLSLVCNFHIWSKHFTSFYFQLTFHFSYDESCIQFIGTNFSYNERCRCYQDGVTKFNESFSWSHFMTSIYNRGIYTVGELDLSRKMVLVTDSKMVRISSI